MLNRILPRQADNNFRGNVMALWLFVPIVFLKLAISVGPFFNPDGGLQSADGIPLDTYPAAAAQAMIGIGAILDLANLLLVVVYIVALLRYRALIPLMYVLMVADFLGHKAVLIYKPIVRMAGTATGVYVTWGIFALTVIGLVLSLSGKRYRAAQEAAATAA